MKDHIIIPSRERHEGFSLLELLIVLVIIALTAAITAPSIISMAPARQLKSAARDLHSALMEAKMQAIKENRDISVRISNTEFYIDEDGDGIRDADEPGTTFEDYDDDFDNNVGNARKGVQNFVPPELTKNWNDVDITLDQRAVFTYNSRGLMTTASGSVYLVNNYVANDYATLKADNENISAYAISASTVGSVKTRRYFGTLPIVQGNWE